MAGPDEIDGRGWQLRLPENRPKISPGIQVSIVYTDPEAEVDEEVQGRLRALADFLAKKKSAGEGKRPPRDKFP